MIAGSDIGVIWSFLNSWCQNHCGRGDCNLRSLARLLHFRLEINDLAWQLVKTLPFITLKDLYS